MSWKTSPKFRGWYRAENEIPSQCHRSAPGSRFKYNQKLDYAGRNIVLRRLGFEDYRTYLASELWADIRRRALSKSRRCYCCRRKKKATQVHHLFYTEENLSGHVLRGLKPLCAVCHQAIEFSRSGKKLDPRRVYAKLQRLRRSKTWPRKVIKMAQQHARNQQKVRRQVADAVARDR